MKSGVVIVLFMLVAALSAVSLSELTPSVRANKSAASDLVMVSGAERVSASPDMAVGPDGSLNLLWVDKGEAKPPAAADAHAGHNMPSAPPKAGPPQAGGHGPGRSHTHINYSNLYFARSTDGGKTFTAPIRVNAKDGGVWGFATSRPRIAVSKSGIIHVFYSANRRDKSAARQAVDSCYTRSTDGGKTWEPVRTLNSEGKGMDDGELDEAHCFGTMGVAPNGDVHAYWIDTRHMKGESDNGAIYGIVSRNEGKTFEKEKMIVQNEACPCCQLSLAFANDGKVWLTLRHVSGDNLRDSALMRSDDGGRTFAAAVRVSDKQWNIKACPLKPLMATTDKNGRLYAAWFAGEMQPAGVFFATSDDKGKTFSKPLAMHTEAKVSDHASVTVAGDGTVYVAWDARVGDLKRVYLRSSSNQGKTFSPVMELDAPAGAADYPVIAANKQGRVFIAWQQNSRVMLRALPTMVAQK